MGRLRGCIWLGAGVVVALLAGLVAYITLSRAAGQPQAGSRAAGGPTVPVLAAAQAVPVRTALAAKDLVVRQMPVEAAPQGYLSKTDEAIGKITLTELVAGEPILRTRLADPNVVSPDGRVAIALAEDSVLMAFPATDLLSRVGVLRPGDHIDILFSVKVPVNRSIGSTTGGNDEQATIVVLQDVVIAAAPSAGAAAGGAPLASAAGAGQALLLTVSPQDALVLKYVKDAQGSIVDVVLRAPGAERPATTEPVDPDYLIRRYRIPTEVGR